MFKRKKKQEEQETQEQHDKWVHRVLAVLFICGIIFAYVLQS